MKKSAYLITLLLMVTALFAGCMGANLAQGFDEAKIKEAAKTAVTTLDKKDYTAFSALVSDGTKSSLSEDTLKKAVNQVMPEAGKFVEFTNEGVAGQRDKGGNDIAVSQIVAKYEKQNVTYTISFDKDMKIVGFYLK